MKRRQGVLRSIVHWSFLLLWACILCGCTVIGFGTGALIDSGKPDMEVLLPDGASNLSSGDEVRISLVDSTVIEGTYERSADLASPVYALRYARFQERTSSSTPFPHLGDTLLVTMNTGNSQLSYTFCGFGSRSMNVQWLGQSQIGRIAFRNIHAMENRSGEKFRPALLDTMSSEHRLPLDVALVVKTTLDTVSIPFDDIRFVERANSKNAKWIGLGVGFVIDAIATLSISSAMSHMGDGLGSTSFH